MRALLVVKVGTTSTPAALLQPTTDHNGQYNSNDAVQLLFSKQGNIGKSNRQQHQSVQETSQQLVAWHTLSRLDPVS
jgi:hypothetical protein